MKWMEAHVVCRRVIATGKVNKIRMAIFSVSLLFQLIAMGMTRTNQSWPYQLGEQQDRSDSTDAVYRYSTVQNILWFPIERGRTLLHDVLKPSRAQGRAMFMKIWECSHFKEFPDVPHATSRLSSAKDLFCYLNKNYGTLAFCRKWLDCEGYPCHQMVVKMLTYGGGLPTVM